MDVRGAALDCIDQHLVDELHYRRVVCRAGIDAGVGIFLAVAKGKFLKTASYVVERVEARRAHAVDLVDQA